MRAPFLRLVAGTAIVGPVTTAAEPSGRPAPDRELIQREPITATHANKLARDHRRDAWRRAEALTQYWRARLNMYSAAQLAKTYELPEARNHPQTDEDGRMALVAHWRAAKVNQLLTPAYQAAGVLWKKEHLTAGHLDYLPVERRQVERAIAADEAFLASHPVRQTKSAEAKAQRCAFKEAMRQRIREVAALRKIPEDEIRPVLRLKHQEIGRFTEAHGVNVGWLLEGEGQMFKSGPKLAVDHGEDVQP
jgi:hypothetical protein